MELGDARPGAWGGAGEEVGRRGAGGDAQQKEQRGAVARGERRRGREGRRGDEEAAGRAPQEDFFYDNSTTCTVDGKVQ